LPDATSSPPEVNWWKTGISNSHSGIDENLQEKQINSDNSNNAEIRRPGNHCRWRMISN